MRGLARRACALATRAATARAASAGLLPHHGIRASLLTSAPNTANSTLHAPSDESDRTVTRATTASMALASLASRQAGRAGSSIRMFSAENEDNNSQLMSSMLNRKLQASTNVKDLLREVKRYHRDFYAVNVSQSWHVLFYHLARERTARGET